MTARRFAILYGVHQDTIIVSMFSKVLVTSSFKVCSLSPGFRVLHSIMMRSAQSCKFNVLAQSCLHTSERFVFSPIPVSTFGCQFSGIWPGEAGATILNPAIGACLSNDNIMFEILRMTMVQGTSE